MTDTSENESAIVVGAGVVGIACAHYLSRAGFQVTVIDRGSIAGACSYGNCGYICASHVLPLTEPGAIGIAVRSLFNPYAPSRVKPRLSPALWKWMWQFARRCTHRQMVTAGKHLQAILDASIEEYRHLVPELGLDCQWKDNGLLYVFQTGKGMREFAETDRLLTERFGVAAVRIEGPELPDFDPALKPGLAGAFHYPGDASVRPDQLNAQWAMRLRDRGVEFLENCDLQDIATSSRRITALKTSRGEMRADRIVFAMGAWSACWSDKLGCRLPVEPGKGYSVTMPRPEVCPQYPMLLPEHKVGVSPFQDGFRLGSMMEFSGYDTSIPEHRIEQLRESARPYLRASVSGPAEETWYGWRPMTWDSLPIIGAVPGLNNAFLATGHNMLGLTLAPATGRLLTELITGEETHIEAAPFSVERF